MAEDVNQPDNGKLEELRKKFGDKINPQDFPQPEPEKIEPKSPGESWKLPESELDVNLETLRGPNRTEDLARLIQQVTHAPDAGTGRTRDTALEKVIYHLQSWADKVDGEVSVGLSANPPKNATQLYQETSRLIKEGFVPNQLDFFKLYEYSTVSDWLRFWRQDMWQLIYELFKIDRSGLGLYRDGWAVRSSQIGHDSKAVNRYMLQLISNQLGKDGRKLTEETGKDSKGFQMAINWGQTVIPGVVAGISISERSQPNRVAGYPNIHEFYLGFDPSFIAGVRPLTREQLNTYSKPTPDSLST